MNSLSQENNPCSNCPIEEKIHQCCYRDPESGMSSTLLLGRGKEVTACPHLNPEGLCRQYMKRPGGCRDFICDRYRSQSTILNLVLEGIITGFDS